MSSSSSVQRVFTVQPDRIVCRRVFRTFYRRRNTRVLHVDYTRRAFDFGRKTTKYIVLFSSVPDRFRVDRPSSRHPFNATSRNTSRHTHTRRPAVLVITTLDHSFFDLSFSTSFLAANLTVMAIPLASTAPPIDSLDLLSRV